MVWPKYHNEDVKGTHQFVQSIHEPQESVRVNLDEGFQTDVLQCTQETLQHCGHADVRVLQDLLRGYIINKKKTVSVERRDDRERMIGEILTSMRSTTMSRLGIAEDPTGRAQKSRTIPISAMTN